jgi:hypothetical protein
LGIHKVLEKWEENSCQCLATLAKHDEESTEKPFYVPSIHSLER